MNPSPSLRPDPNRELEQLVRAHQTAVWRYLRFLGCGPTEADDLSQETFLSVVGRPVHRFGPSGARAYLRRVARNCYLKSARARRPDSVDLETAEQAFEWFRGDDEGEATIAALRACLGELSADGRRALELRYRDDLDRGAIADRIGMSSHGVKSLMQRSYARLRACITRRLRRA